MSGAHGGPPADGDEPVAARPGASDDPTERAEPVGDDDDAATEEPETGGVEILDAGADWLAVQLANLPPDTTEIPVMEASGHEGDGRAEAANAGAEAQKTEAESVGAESTEAESTEAESAGADDQGDESGTDEDLSPTVAVPVVPAAVPASADTFVVPPRPPLPSIADDEAEPPFTRPRAGGPSPSSAVLGEAAPVPASGPRTTEGDEGSDEPEGDHEPEDDDGAEDDETPVRRSSFTPPPAATDPPIARSHPNAIALPGLPPRDADAATIDSGPPDAADVDPDTTPGSDADTTPDNDADNDADNDNDNDIDAERTSDGRAGAHSPAAAEPDSGGAAAGSASAPPTNDTEDIDFGSFVWSLTPNDQGDPRLEREIREAESRAAEAAAVAAAESSATQDPESQGPATPNSETDRSTSQDSTSQDPASQDPASQDSASQDSTSQDPASQYSASGASADTPSWSRPDLDDAFPATAAMTTLPADDDPDDPDDELGADDVSALGTSALPVSAASAAVGEAEHSRSAPAPRAGASASVFPDGLVTGAVAGSGPRRTGESDRDGRRPVRRVAPAPGSPRGALPLVAAGVVIVLALVGLFYLGTRLPLIFAGPGSTAAVASPTPTATPEPTADEPATGPLAAGTYAWDELQGGECLDPYTSPWAEEFAVVDCASPHAAQLVFTAPYSDDPATPFPGADVIASEIGLLCSAPGVIDFEAAAAFTDLQVQGAYPVSAEQWAAGERDYSCFASRSSGEPLTASVATAAP